MHQAPLPQEYADLSLDAAGERIERVRKELSSFLVILGHHYQRDEIIRHADFRGDSYKLARDAANCPEAEFIVFCGVHFMAETADILTPDRVRVILPNMAAGCSMADMANLFQVRSAWQQLDTTLGHMEQVIPVTYVNSAANLKAFVGERGGIVCTSSNAHAAVTWALERGKKVLFFPDQHLGRNTGVKLGFDPDRDMALWDPFKPQGGNSEGRLRDASFILWKGHCSVHSRFTVAQIEKARQDYPNVRVIVHPECELAVVRAADENGSTGAIIRAIEAAPAGSVWAIGTEINLVSRLAKEHPDQTIFCLDPQICPCSTMYRIHPSFLCWALESLEKGEIVNEVIVPPKVKHFARIALQRMLDLPYR